MAGKKNFQNSNEKPPTLFPFLEEKRPEAGKKNEEVSSNEGKLKSLLLIDANSLIHRAFHALPTSLRNSRGEIVNAAYGFTSMLIKVIKEFNPDAVIGAFDTKAPTFRHQAFKEYKANRPETADELVPQFKLVKKVLDAFDIPYLEVPGFEADDIIATLASQAAEKGLEVLILSGDRDLLQLVGDKIRVITTKKGVSEVKIYDRDGVYQRFKVHPEQIPDFLALKGEASDNIPGVPGIGEKTAADLIGKYGSLENLFKNLKDLEGKKYYSALKESMENVFKARDLVILRKDVPVSFNEVVRRFSYDKLKVAKALTELEFQSLIKRLDIDESAVDFELELTEGATEASFEEVLKALNKEGEGFIVILEDKLFLSTKHSYCQVLVPVDFEKIFNTGATLFVNNLKEFYKTLPEELGLTCYQLSKEGKIHDLSILLWLNNPDKKKYTLTDYLPQEKWKEHLNDALVWARNLLKKITSENMDRAYYEVEIKIPAVLAEMEKAGLPINLDILYDLKKELEREIENLEQKIFEFAGVKFNIDSPKQLSDVLYRVLKIKPPRSRKKYSTEQAVLLKLIDAHPIILPILNYRELTKLKRTYVEPFIEKVNKEKLRIYGKFNQVGTATGRLSSEEPNLQNIPLKGTFAQRFREAIACKNGWLFVSADYANIDLRVLAHLSDEKRLIEAFKNNEDIHTRTAVEIFKVKPDEVDERLRRMAKAINFGIIYGVSPEGLAQQAGISIQEAKAYIEEYFKKYPGVKEYIDRVVQKAYEEGYVETILRRRRYLPGLKSSSLAERNAAERLAMNTPIQGSSADIIKLAMVRLYEEIKTRNLPVKLLLQIHDSLVLEAPEELADEAGKILVNSMENAFQLKVPLKAKLKTASNLSEL